MDSKRGNGVVTHARKIMYLESLFIFRVEKDGSESQDDAKVGVCYQRSASIGAKHFLWSQPNVINGGRGIKSVPQSYPVN